MNKELVVKDNALVNAAYKLTLAEQRLILLSIVVARKEEKGIDANNHLTISASDYMQLFDVTKQTAYEALKDAAKHLFSREFSYQARDKKGRITNVRSRWVSEVAYTDITATVKLIFAPSVVPMITQLEKQFTSYEIEKVANLTSTYAIRLYELIICWKVAKKTPVFELEDFRNKLGVGVDEYVKMNNFKARVLDIAIKQINNNTDITIKVEQHKQGRSISGFSFTFSYKEAPQAAALKALTSSTAKSSRQLGYYAKLLANSHWATQARVLQGVNSSDTINVITAYIKQPANFEKVKPIIDRILEKEKANKGRLQPLSATLVC